MRSSFSIFRVFFAFSLFYVLALGAIAFVGAEDLRSPPIGLTHLVN